MARKKIDGVNSKIPEGGKDTDAMRDNYGKPAMHLIPWGTLPHIDEILCSPLALQELARHYAAGAKKYEPWNWLKGGDWSVCIGAFYRHYVAFSNGADYDPETKTHHLAACLWNAITLFHYQRNSIGRDDRSKILPLSAPQAPPGLRTFICWSGQLDTKDVELAALARTITALISVLQGRKESEKLSC